MSERTRIRIGASIDELVRLGRGSRAEIAARLCAAALEAARKKLGVGTPLTVDLDRDELRVTQDLTVVEHVHDPRRELSLGAARELDGEAQLGDLMSTIIAGISPNMQEPTRVGPWPLPVVCDGLDDVMTDAVSTELLRDFPAPRLPDGSVAAVFAAGGAWLRGRCGSAGGVSIAIVETTWTLRRVEPHQCWIRYGLVLRVEGAEAEPALRQVEREVQCRGDQLGETTLPVARDTAAARERVEAMLVAFAEKLAQVPNGGGQVEASHVLARLVTAALRPATAGSLSTWIDTRASELLVGASWAATHAATGQIVRFEITRLLPQDLVELRRLSPAIVVRYQLEGSSAPGVEDPWLDELSLGPLGDWALEAGPRGSDDERALCGLIELFQQWLRGMSSAWLEAEGLPSGSHHFTFSERPLPYWPLATLMEHRLRDGDPGEPPIPAVAAGGRTSLRRVAPDDPVRPPPRNAFAVIEADGWRIACGDQLESFPFQCPWISILAPGELAWCEVLRVDAWNPTSRAVIDGDAHAFRRFVDWLAAGLTAAGLDQPIAFAGNDLSQADDPDVVATPRELRLCEWLEFAVFREGDRFIADWRFQWDIVAAGESITTALGTIYAMSPTERERLDGHDTTRWRRFLGEVFGSDATLHRAGARSG